MKLWTSCKFCHDQLTVDVDVGDWVAARGVGVLYAEAQALCEKHAGAAQWLNDQCPGCMHGFTEGGNCRVYAAIEDLTPAQPLTDADYYSIAAGKCPRRINGTFSVRVHNGVPVGGIEEMDLSEPSEAGQAMVAALKDSIEWLKDAMARRRG